MIAMLKTLPGVRTDQVEFAVFMTFSAWPGRRARARNGSFAPDGAKFVPTPGSLGSSLPEQRDCIGTRLQ